MATLIILLIWSLLPLAASAAITSVPALEDRTEYDLKAAFLINFARFTEWPSDKFSGPDAPLIIAIYGVDPFNRSAFDELASKPVNGRHVQVRRVQDLKDIEGCHLLFIHDVDEKTLVSVINSVRDKHVLTVGAGAKFTAAGGMIRFFIEEAKVRFEINLIQAQRAGLQVSAKLLSVAKVINETH